MNLIWKITLSILILSFPNFTYAGDYEGYSGVIGTVEIGICGDGIVEGVEECEPSVSIVNNCSDLGYDKGELTCDPSCSFNKSSCEYVPPTPVLPPYPNVYVDEDDDKPTRIELPFFLTLYDIDSNGKISTVEYCDGLTYWLKKWRIRLLDPKPEGDIARIAGAKDTCDLNFDKNCDLTDFSIFLHNN